MLKKSPDYLTPLLAFAPASWALIRANEIRNLDNVRFPPPVLDVGCGDGLVTKILLKNKQKFDWGIDLSVKEIEKAKRSGSYKHCKVANVYDLPFKDESFQTVFSNSVVEHIPNLDLAFAEISRVLKKGGRVIITIPSSYLTDYLIGTNFFKYLKLNFLATIYGKFFNFLFKHHHLYTHRQWERILNGYSLKLIDHKYYHTPGMVKVHEMLSYLSIPNKLSKLILGRFIVFPQLRKALVVPWLRKLLWRFYLADSKKNQGGSLLIIAQKV